MKYFTLILFIICALTAQAYEYGDAECRLIKVIDGDTIKCDIPGFPPIIGRNISVRFRGINTPEIHGSQTSMGYVSKAKLEAILSRTRSITLKDISRDKYFRIDADIYADGTKINTPELLYP